MYIDLGKCYFITLLVYTYQEKWYGSLSVLFCIRGTDDNQKWTEFNENKPLRDDVKLLFWDYIETHYFNLITYWTKAEMAKAITQALSPFYNTFSQTIGDVLRVCRTQVYNAIRTPDKVLCRRLNYLNRIKNATVCTKFTFE